MNEGWTRASLYSKLVSAKVCLQRQHCHCHANIVDDNKDKDGPASKLIDLSDEIFHVGEMILCLIEGRTTYVRIKHYSWIRFRFVIQGKDIKW